MGCVSSALLNRDEEFPQIGGSAAFSHHIVSLTSTTYGLLTLDPPPRQSPATVAPPTQTPPPRCTLGSLFPIPLSEPPSLSYQPLETVNSWDLMKGLDSGRIPSFRFSPSPFTPSELPNSTLGNQSPKEENVNPNIGKPLRQLLDFKELSCKENVNPKMREPLRQLLACKELNSREDLFQEFEMICPPNGENKVVMYSTSLRGVRKTFENCNAIRSAFEGLGILICERDISMDRGLRDELRELMKGKDKDECIPPRVFVKGRYIGGIEKVMKIVEDGYIGELLKGLPKSKGVHLCEGCGGVRFLPCFTCNGSCKMVMTVGFDVGVDMEVKQVKGNVVVRCSDCNENGLVLCPICA